MEKAEARKLQPFFIRSFFMKAFQQLGRLDLHPREIGRYEITFVPASIRERDRQISGRDRRKASEIDADWIKKDLEEAALSHASDKLVPEHFEEVVQRRERQIDKNLAAIHERLVKEIDYWSDRHEKLKTDLSAGKDVRLPLENVRRTIDELTVASKPVTKELQAMRHVVSGMPVVVGGALVIPAGLIAMRSGEAEGPTWSADAQARARVEKSPWRLSARRRRPRPSGDRCVSREVRMGHHGDCACGRRQAPASPAHRGQGTRPKANRPSPSPATKSSTGLNQADKFILAIVIRRWRQP
jgi:hypothetical protein